MQFLIDLWVPIVVAAVVVFVLSSVIHMALPVHKGDYGRMPGEEDVLAALREAGVGRGTYMFPGCASMKELGEPGMLEKFDKGPVGYMTVIPNGAPAIGRSLVQWFALSLLVGVFAAYVAQHALAPGAAATDVCRVTGTLAVAAYGFGAIQDSIWKGVPWGITTKFLLDGVVYGVATGIVFAWLWPGA